MKRPDLYSGSEGDYLSRWKRILHLDKGRLVKEDIFAVPHR